MIKRLLQQQIEQRLKPGKAVLLYGARRVGKTMLAHAVADAFDGKTMLLNGEDMDVQAQLSNRSVANYRNLFGGIGLLVIDEAQNIGDIGKVIKLIVDEVPGITVLATGSSSFELQGRAGEPLVGRATTMTLTPFSRQELAQHQSPIESRGTLESRLLYGTYPEVALMASDADRAEYLRDMVDAYLLKDILSIDGLRNASKMRKLLQLVAYQVTGEVSYEGLGRELSLSRDTVEKYLNLLSQVFIVYRLGAFSRNLRKEVSKAGKWYFIDNGVRNAIIGNFKPLGVRDDCGALWENYMVSEFHKRHLNGLDNDTLYFWRTFDQQEIDLVVTRDEAIEAYEFKWGSNEPRIPRGFANAYPDAGYHVISPNNVADFL